MFTPAPQTCHMSCVTCHMSPVTCHVSRVTCFFFFSFFFGQSGEAYWWRVFYQRGLPRLVSQYIVVYRVLRILKLERHPNCIIGSKVTTTLWLFVIFFFKFRKESTVDNGGVSRGHVTSHKKVPKMKING